MEFRELLLQLKIHYSVKTNKELAYSLGLSEDAIKAWNKKKSIPKKYLKVLEKDTKSNINITHGNNNTISGHNSGVNIHGDVHINNIEQQDRELCEIIKQLDPKQKEYYYHLMKADLIKKNL